MLLIKHAHLIMDEHTELSDVDIYIENGKILEIGKIEKENCKVIDAKHQFVIPGMIDVHLHGSMGFDFTDGNQKVIDEVSNDVIKDGVTGYLGSLTVVSHEKMMNILDNYSKVIQSNGAIFHGIHAEGPYISMEYKAVMNPKFIRPFSEEEFNEIIKYPNLVKTMTYSPSIENANRLLELGIKNNIAMMVGHTSASCEQSLDAIKNGAKGFTHLYNAMSPHTHRDPGTVTAAFNSTGFCELITDTVHVHPEVIKMTYKGIGSSRIILVTDAMNAKSLEDGLYNFSDLMILKKDGKAYVPETGRLAGSVACLNECMRNMKEITNASYPQLIEMVSVNPAKLLNIDNHKGRLQVGYDADIAILDQDFNCITTIIDGKIVYQKND